MLFRIISQNPGIYMYLCSLKNTLKLYDQSIQNMKGDFEMEYTEHYCFKRMKKKILEIR